MTSEEARNLQANLTRLQVAPPTAQLLQAHEPDGCRLDVRSENEAQLLYRGQAIYGGERILETVAGQSRDLVAGKQPDLVVFFGLGLGFHLAEIRKHTAAPIVVLEPSADLAAFVLARITVDLDDVYLVGDGNALADRLSTLLPVRPGVVAGAIPACRTLFAAQFDEFLQVVNEEIGKNEIGRETKRQFAETWVANLAANLTFLGTHQSLQALGRAFAGRPAILVGAGPSLDRNLSELAAAQGRALIVAVHTALQPLARAGITPDLVVIIECQELGYYFEDVARLNESVLLASAHTHPSHLAHGFRETVAVNMEGVAAADWLAEAYGERPLPSGGSVACTAFAALHELGCDPIALVGMDTAYGGKRGHARHSQTECCEFSFDTKQETVTTHCRAGVHQPLVFRLVMTPAWGGQGEVATRPALASFRTWFEAAARTWAGDRMLINATEGGARIAGFREATLAEFLAEFCEPELAAAELIAAGLSAAPPREPAALAAAVQNELEVIRQAGQVAELAGNAAAEALAKLQDGKFSTVQPLLDRLSRREKELRTLSLSTRLLNTMVGGRIADLVADRASGDHVARTIHSVAQSRRVSQLVSDGARELLDRFEPALQAMVKADTSP